MKITIIYFALILTTILPVFSCIGQEIQPFEGEVIMNIEQGGVKAVVYYTFKGDMIGAKQ